MSKIKSVGVRAIEVIGNLIIISLLLLAVVSVKGKILGKKTSDLFTKQEVEETLPHDIYKPTNKQLKKAGFENHDLHKIKKGVWQVLGSNNNIVAKVMWTTPYTNEIIGYAGPIPLLIFTDLNNKITSIIDLDNDETPHFMNSVIKKGIIKQWIGKDAKSISNFEPDALSGATFTSVAINKVMQKSYPIISNSKTIKLKSKSLDFKPLIALLIIALALYISFFKPANKKIRITLLAINTIVLGFWLGTFISLKAILGWFENGMNIYTSIAFFTIILLAIVLPIFFNKKRFYCTWVCPFGSAQELAGKITKKKVVIPPRVMTYLRYSQTIITLALFFSLWIGLASDIIEYEPFSAFLFQHASIPVIIIAALTIITSVFVTKPWCRFVCPTGQIFNWIEKL